MADDGSGSAPASVATSGICQPPVHSLAVHRIVAIGRRNGGADRREVERFLRETFQAWLDWHRWLSSARDPGRSGLVEIHHSWESGMDNSPRWDIPYAAVVPGPMAPLERRDLEHVENANERPSDRDYERYLWLVEQLVSVGYDDDAARAVIDFRVGDVFMSALLAHSSELLAELADDLASQRRCGGIAPHCSALSRGCRGCGVSEQWSRARPRSANGSVDRHSDDRRIRAAAVSRGWRSETCPARPAARAGVVRSSRTTVPCPAVDRSRFRRVPLPDLLAWAAVAGRQLAAGLGCTPCGDEEMYETDP